jgi:hypothetical protein
LSQNQVDKASAATKNCRRPFSTEFNRTRWTMGAPPCISIGFFLARVGEARWKWMELDGREVATRGSGAKEIQSFSDLVFQSYSPNNSVWSLQAPENDSFDVDQFERLQSAIFPVFESHRCFLGHRKQNFTLAKLDFFVTKPSR